MYDVVDIATALDLTERQTRVFLRKLWNDKGVLIHEKNAQWEFNQQEFNMLCYIYKLENVI